MVILVAIMEVLEVLEQTVFLLGFLRLALLCRVIGRLPRVQDILLQEVEEEIGLRIQSRKAVLAVEVQVVQIMATQ